MRRWIPRPCRIASVHVADRLAGPRVKPRRPDVLTSAERSEVALLRVRASGSERDHAEEEPGHQDRRNLPGDGRCSRHAGTLGGSVLGSNRGKHLSGSAADCCHVDRIACGRPPRAFGRFAYFLLHGGSGSSTDEPATAKPHETRFRSLPRASDEAHELTVDQPAGFRGQFRVVHIGDIHTCLQGVERRRDHGARHRFRHTPRAPLGQ